jgi:cardiolipin synthase
MFKLFRDGKIWTIPNAMSFFRLLLVPVIVWSYLSLENTTLTIILLAVSALTDVLDGRIARRFNMVSDLGKALDPLADKLTQACIVFCLAFSRPVLWILLGMCVVREPCMAILGYITIRKTNKVPCAKWYGKVSTVVLYTTALSLLVFPNMPDWLSTTLIILSILCVSSALLLYTRYYVGVWKQMEAEAS